MKYLVTGANGFLGKHVCQFLREQNVAYRAATRNGDSSQFSTGDMTQFNRWKELFADIQVVIHTAAKAHDMSGSAELEKIYNDVNFELTVKLAEQAKMNGVKKFIFISTIKVNGESTEAQPFKAEDTPHPQDYYALSKHRAEQEILKLNEPGVFEVTIIRPCLIYGYGVKANFKNLIQLVKKGWPLPFGLIKNKRSLVSVDNLIDLIYVCSKSPQAAGQVFLVSDGVDLSLAELIQKIAASMGKAITLIPVPRFILNLSFILIGKKDMSQRLFNNLQVDITKNKKLLNWVPPFTIDQSLKKLHEGT